MAIVLRGVDFCFGGDGMNYDEMSDTQIAGMVLAARGIKYKVEHSTCFISHGFIDGANLYTRFDPCNNPNDIMPIAIEYGFSIELPDSNLGGIGQITKYIPNNTDIEIEFTGLPYRSIAICFLEMKEAEK